jgi:IS30 family transposase
MKNFIRDKLENEQWSPEQIAGYCRENKIEMESCEWIYQHIYKDKKRRFASAKISEHNVKNAKTELIKKVE